MPLTREELQKQLDALDAQEKGKSGPSVNITVDLSDKAAVKRAMKMGYLEAADLDDEDDDTDDDEDGKKGKGKKGDDEDDEVDGAPRRRVTFAEKLGYGDGS